jgi:hypothetical protein
MTFLRVEDKVKRRIAMKEEENVLYHTADLEAWADWKVKLRDGKKWRSSRIDTIIDVFNKQWPLIPDSSIIISDESVFFLDIFQRREEC